MAISVTPDKVQAAVQTPAPAVAAKPAPHSGWKIFAPLVVTLAIALLPPPQGLAPYVWYYFAIFAGVIVGLMLEPLPGGAIGLIGVTVVTVLARFVLFSPAELAKPGFAPITRRSLGRFPGFRTARCG